MGTGKPFSADQTAGLAGPVPGADVVSQIHNDPHSHEAETLNELVQQHPQLAPRGELPKDQRPELHMPPPITRLVANTLTVQKSWDRPVLILPKDHNRQELHITVISATSSDTVYISDEENAGQVGNGNVYIVPAGPNTVTLKHTGPVWVFAPNIVGANTTLAAPSNLAATANASGGTFAAATYYWKVTATNSAGETTGSNEASVAVALNGTASLTWTLPAGATGVKVYRGTAAGAENTLVATLNAVTSYTDTGSAGTAASPPTTNTASTGTSVTVSAVSVTK